MTTTAYGRLNEMDKALALLPWLENVIGIVIIIVIIITYKKSSQNSNKIKLN